MNLGPRIDLPSSREAVSFSVDVQRLPRDFDGLWHHLLRVVSASAEGFASNSGEDVLAWLDITRWWNRQKQPTVLLALYFCTDGRVTAEQLQAFEPSLAASGIPWSVDGVMHRPRSARPVLAVVGGAPHRVWVPREEGHVANSLAIGESIEWHTHGESEPDDGRFLGQFVHSPGQLSQQGSSARAHIERMKFCYAHSVAMRIIEADGVLDEGELEFLRQRFPGERLVELGLEGPAGAAVLEEARATLRDLLGYHEKLGMLSIFYAACYADGRLEVRELRVLREAAEALGLGREEVMRYLERLW